MGHIGRTTLVAALFVVIATRAMAQEPPANPLPALPKWDAGAGIGLLYLQSAQDFSPCSCGDEDWEQTAEFRVDIGRYWTEHIKTSVSVAFSPRLYDYETRIVGIDGITLGISRSISSRPEQDLAVSCGISKRWSESSAIARRRRQTTAMSATNGRPGSGRLRRV